MTTYHRLEGAKQSAMGEKSSMDLATPGPCVITLMYEEMYLLVQEWHDGYWGKQSLSDWLSGLCHRRGFILGALNPITSPWLRRPWALKGNVLLLFC